MSKELNIAAILNEKPTETKLWSPMLGDCIYCYNNTYPEEIIIAFTDKNGEEKEWTFSYSGRTFSAPDTADVCLFPSKQMRDWSKFAWKKGDILTNGESAFVFDKWGDENYSAIIAKHSVIRGGGSAYREKTLVNTLECSLCKDKEYYLKKIENITGGKLNPVTLEIEKQQEFKDGDILHSDETEYSDETLFIAKISDGVIGTHAYIDLSDESVMVRNDTFEDSEIAAIRPATDSEKQQLFDALAKEGKRWNPDTKQIEDLPKGYEFKAFDKVLVRDVNSQYWIPSFFAQLNPNANVSVFKYGIALPDGFKYFAQCIPYNEETKHLLGTTDDWKGGEG